MRTAAPQVVALKKKYPCYTLQQIATRVGVSRERVRQILVEYNLPTRGIKQYLYACWYCNAPLTPKNSRPSHGQNNLVCRACYQEYERFVTVACDNCDGLFSREYSEVIRNRPNSVTGFFQNHIFCSKDCQGAWLAKNYGFVVFPEHQRFGTRSKKSC